MSAKHLSRRALLRASSVAAAVFSTGCSAIDRESTDEVNQASSCRSGHRWVEALEDRSIVYSDSTDPFLGFTLEVDPETITSGDEFTITLTNASDRELEIFADDRIAVQAEYGGGWSTVVGVPEDHEWDDRTTTMAAGETRTWEIRNEVHDFGPDPLVRCSIFTEAPYRAVFWGFPHEPDSDPLALATEFTVVEPE